jgi:hypothetical protein
MQQDHPASQKLTEACEPTRDDTLLDDLLTLLRHPGLRRILKERYGHSIPPLIVAGTDCFLIGAILEKEWQCEWSEGSTLAKAAANAAAAVRALAIGQPAEDAPPAERRDVALVLTHPRFYSLQWNTRRASDPGAEAQCWYCVGLTRGAWIEWWNGCTSLEAVQAAARALRARSSFPPLGGRLLDLLADWRSSR